MTHSMTAFARVQKQLDTGIFCWEIKSVNHRYLDVSFRLPEAFRFLEPNLRTSLRDKISRGKVECQLKFQDINGINQTMLINETLVNGLLEAGNRLAINKHLANDITLKSILTWPGVVQIAETDSDALAEQASQLFETALAQLIVVRKVEGQALTAHIQQRLEKLHVEINNARGYVEGYAIQTRDKLLTRVQNLQLDLTNTRLEQEIALMLTKLDVSEELDRLQTHATEVAKSLMSAEAAGRRLDFLMQELNREANTVSSKSDLINLTQTAVEMKVLIEQMREQIQNIE